MMKKNILFLLFCCFIQFGKAQDTLRLKTMFQPKFSASFELSGLAQDANGQVFMVNDDKKKIYYLKDQKIIESACTKKWKLNIRDADWEAIDLLGDKIVVLSENTHTIMGDNWRLTPDFSDYQTRMRQDLYPDKWGNAGFEGFCFADSTIFFAKERSAGSLNDGCYILEVNHQGKILRKFTLPPIGTLPHRNPDFTDLKYWRKGDDAFLYILERNHYLVSRLNLKTNQVTRYSYSKYATNKQFFNALYRTKNPQYGMAEALLITDDEIWIGFDNNGSTINSNYLYAQKYNLSGRQCTIMVFDRGDF